MFLWRARQRHRIDIFGSLDPFRSRFKSPRDHQRNWKTDCDQHDHQTNDPVWNFEERKNLRRNLSNDPAHNRVRDRDLVNVAPPQLSEEIHALALP